MCRTATATTATPIVQDQVDPAHIEAQAQQIAAACKGGGTDEEEIFAILEEATPEELEAIEAYFNDNLSGDFEGMSLRSLLRDEMSGDELSRALNALENGELRRDMKDSMQMSECSGLSDPLASAQSTSGSPALDPRLAVLEQAMALVTQIDALRRNGPTGRGEDFSSAESQLRALRELIDANPFLKGSAIDQAYQALWTHLPADQRIANLKLAVSRAIAGVHIDAVLGQGSGTTPGNASLFPAHLDDFGRLAAALQGALAARGGSAPPGLAAGAPGAGAPPIGDDMLSRMWHSIDSDGQLTALINGTLPGDDLNGPLGQAKMFQLQQRMQLWTTFIQSITAISNSFDDANKAIVRNLA